MVTVFAAAWGATETVPGVGHAHVQQVFMIRIEVGITNRGRNHHAHLINCVGC